MLHQSTIESLRQLSLLIRSSQTLLHKGKKTDWARDTIAKLESFSSSSSFDKKHVKSGIVTWEQLQYIEKDCVRLQEVERVNRDCCKECRALGCFPLDIFDVTLSGISKTLGAASECRRSPTAFKDVNNLGSGAHDFSMTLSSAIERTLITFQNFWKDASTSKPAVEAKDSNGSGVDSSDISIWDCHKGLMNAWTGINLKNLNQTLTKLLQQLCNIFHLELGLKNMLAT